MAESHLMVFWLQLYTCVQISSGQSNLGYLYVPLLETESVF